MKSNLKSIACNNYNRIYRKTYPGYRSGFYMGQAGADGLIPRDHLFLQSSGKSPGNEIYIDTINPKFS